MDFNWVWVAAAIILTLGCALQTAVGFGMAVIAAPVIMLLEPSWVPYVLTSTALVLSLMNAWHQRAHLQLALIAPAALSRIPGTVIGAWLLVTISLPWLHLIVALCVLIAVLVSLIKTRFEATPSRMAIAGLFSGLMGTTTSIGGPPMALVMQHGDPKVIRASLGMYFAYSCIISMISYAIAGLLDTTILLLCASFFPAAILGFVIGKGLHSRVDGSHFRGLTLWLCAMASVVAIIGTLHQFFF